MSANRWTGTQSKRARKLIRGRGRFQSCWRCGRPLDLDVDTWTAGHTTDRMDGGTDLEVLAECPRCNYRAGGQRGARLINDRREALQRRDQRLGKW